MRDGHKSNSRFWGPLHRLFHRRSSGRRRETNTTIPTESDISDITDGFYLYSQSLINEEAEKLEALKAQSSESTGMSYASARMEPYPHQPTTPYAIGSADWVLPVSPRSSPVNPKNVHGVSRESFYTVLEVFTKVYCVAKIAYVALTNYEVELDDYTDSVLQNIRRCEDVVTSNCVSVLIDAVEHLFYSLQAKLILELANCELCASFKLDVRQRAFEDKFTLPPAWQMHKILVGFKEALDCPSVARHVNHELIKDHQESINFNAMKTLIDVGGTIANDVLGYRRFVLEIVSDEESSFNKKWDGLAHVYDPPPKDVVMIHSERYVAIFPMVTVPYDRPFSELPFDEGEPEDIDEYERQIIVAHRNATLAKLEGSSVGKVRREENRRSIPDYVREKKCVCLSSCSCSHECTYDVERECPCAERMMRIVLSDCRTEPGNHTFGFRCTSLGRVIFEGLCAMRHDCTPEDINAEMDRALEVFDHEIQVEREAFPSIEEMAF